MNLKRRLIIANAETVIIPLIITVLIALAFVFVYGKLAGNDLSFENYQKLSKIKFELINSENFILNQTPENLEDESFQKDLQSRVAGFGGKVILTKDDRVLYSSGNFSKIDLAKLIEAGINNKPASVGNQSFAVQTIDLNFKDSSKGKVLLLAPVDKSLVNLRFFLVFTGVLFILTFVVTNIFVSFQFSHSILKPLNNLQKAASEIRSGNLDFQIVEEGDKEIQELCRDLELMRLKLKESIHTQLKYEENRKMLVSSISHDLKTPVTSIKGYVEGIFDGIANTPEKMDRYLHTIYLKTTQVDQMINDLLLYAKLDLKQIPFNFERTDIAEYVKSCLLESEPEFEADHIKLTFINELSQEHHVFMDRERMKRVIMNILDNSRKYMNKDQGQIKLLLRETNSSIIIELSDNGSGIAESDLPYIFDRFFRSDTARSDIKGSGLGLAIAKQIVEGHNGRIWALSHGSEGTSIMISLSKS